MVEDGGNECTWSAGGPLQPYFDRSATIDELLRMASADNKVTVHAEFKLRSPDSLIVSGTTSLNGKPTGFWDALENRM